MIIRCLSFLRRQESRKIIQKMDTRLRGYDEKVRSNDIINIGFKQ